MFLWDVFELFRDDDDDVDGGWRVELKGGWLIFHTSYRMEGERKKERKMNGYEYLVGIVKLADLDT